MDLDMFMSAMTGLAAAVLIIAVCAFLGINQYASYRCNSYGEMTGIDTTYIHFDGCYLKNGDRHEPLNIGR
jgi:hypothetical protein